MIMYRFLAIIEKASGNYSAYSSDLRSCVAAGGTCEETRRNMQEAMEMHVRELREDDLPVLESQAFAEYNTMP